MEWDYGQHIIESRYYNGHSPCDITSQRLLCLQERYEWDNCEDNWKEVFEDRNTHFYGDALPENRTKSHAPLRKGSNRFFWTAKEIGAKIPTGNAGKTFILWEADLQRGYYKWLEPQYEDKNAPHLCTAIDEWLITYERER